MRLVDGARALVSPGLLTRRYIDGKRAPYLTPLRLYLLASVVVFSSVLALPPPRADTVNLYVGGELVGASQPTRGRATVRLLEPESQAAD